jgi:hypothetical protein
MALKLVLSLRSDAQHRVSKAVQKTIQRHAVSVSSESCVETFPAS